MKRSTSIYTPYESLVRQLYQINVYCAAKLGLENIVSLHKTLGSPLDKVPNIIHVGGTNGKGSVAFKIAKSLQFSGTRTGLFVSPHIASFRERMQVDGELITEKEVVELLGNIMRVREATGIPATFFEIATALAFDFFALRRPAATVIEVGLGGRLDATNIVQPRLSIITSIGLEHTKILGTTIEAIAKEKAGIIKPGVPAVLGPKTPIDLLSGIAKERGSPVLLVPQGPYHTFEEENSAIAQMALDHLRQSSNHRDGKTELALTESGIARGLVSRPPCRFEVLEREVQVGGRRRVRVPVVLDVGHNPPALQRLYEWLCQKFGSSEKKRRRMRVVLGLSADKDLALCMATVLKYVDANRLHVVKALHPRAAQPTELAQAASKVGVSLPPSHHGYQSVGQGVQAALQEAAAAAGGGEEEKEADVVVICGTFFIMGEARQALGFDEPQDSAVIAEVAGAQFAAVQDNVSDMTAPSR